MHSQKNSDYIKNYIIVFIVLLVIINIGNDKKEHLDEVALSNMSTMYNNGNLTATDITVTGKINFINGDKTVTTLTNPGNKLLTSDSNINANGLVVGQTVDPEWHHGIAINKAENIEAVTGKIKHNTGLQMYGNGAAKFPVDIEVVGPIIATGGVKGNLAVTGQITGQRVTVRNGGGKLDFWITGDGKSSYIEPAMAEGGVPVLNVLDCNIALWRGGGGSITAINYYHPK